MPWKIINPKSYLKMKTKTISTIIIAVVFIAAMIIYREKPLPELIAYFVGAAGTISAIWNWYKKDEYREKNKELENQNIDLKIQRTLMREKLHNHQHKVNDLKRKA